MTTNRENAKERKDDRLPAAKIDWGKPGAPAVPQPGVMGVAEGNTSGKTGSAGSPAVEGAVAQPLTTTLTGEQLHEHYVAARGGVDEGLVAVANAALRHASAQGAPAVAQPTDDLTDEQIIELHDSMFPAVAFEREKIMGNVVRFTRAAIAAHLAQQPKAEQPAGDLPSEWQLFANHFGVDPETIDYSHPKWEGFIAGLEVSRESAAYLASKSQAAQPTDDDQYSVIVDRRDLFDYLRAAWREGSSVGWTDTAESWHKATDYAEGVIKGWGTMRAAYIAGTSQATKAQAEPIIPAHLREFVEAVAHNFTAYDEGDDEHYCRGCSALIVNEAPGTQHQAGCIVPRAKAALAAPVAKEAPAVPKDWMLRSLVADLLHLLPITFEFAEKDRATGNAVVSKLRAILAAAPAAPTAQEVTNPTDAQRYQRLRILGAAPYGTKQLAAGNVLRFQSLDDFLDADIAAHPSRGEFAQEVTQQAAPTLQDWLKIIHDDELTPGDRLQRISSRIQEIRAILATQQAAKAETAEQVKTWQERRQNGSNFERAMLDEIADLRRVLGNIVANAEIQPDARMGGKTDCYAVPLDDVDAARCAIPEARAEAVRIEGEPDESFYRRVVFNNGWNACLQEFIAPTTSTVSAPAIEAKTWKDAPYKLGHVAEAWARGWNEACASFVASEGALEAEILARRIAITPENEGGFHADEYGDQDTPIAKGYGETPSAAIRALKRTSTDQADTDTGSAE